jgi:hypothetical protein
MQPTTTSYALRHNLADLEDPYRKRDGLMLGEAYDTESTDQFGAGRGDACKRAADDR